MVEDQSLTIEQARKMLEQEVPHVEEFRYILEHIDSSLKGGQEMINIVCGKLLEHKDFKVSDATWIRALSKDQKQRDKASEKGKELMRNSNSVSTEG